MRLQVHFFIAMLCIGSLISCKSNTQSEQKSDTENIPEELIVTEETETDDSDDEIQEYGRILSIEDGVYPMFVVTVDFPARKMKQDFNLNIEAVGSLTTEDLGPLNGNYATIYYTSELENNLLDIHVGQTTLLGEYAPEFDPTWKSITGILQDAQEETVSDLPDVITIQEANGNTMTFEIYITPEMVAANGKEVTVFYYIRGSHDITEIIPAEEY